MDSKPTVGIDARTLVGGRSGVGNYLVNVLRVGAFDGYRVLAYYDAADGDPPSVSVPTATDLVFEGVETSGVVNTMLGPVRPVWWVNVALHARLRRDGVDAFLGPNFVQPVGFSGPSVVVVHDMVHRVVPEAHPRAHRWYLRVALPMSLRQADRTVVVSQSTRNDLERFHDVDPDDVTVAPGAAAARFRPRSVDEPTRERLRREYDLPDRFLLFVGNVEPRKNLSTLLIALGQFEDDRRPSLVVVGQKHVDDRELTDTYRQCSFRSDVHFTGYVPDGDLPLLYNLATAFVYPSLYEGFGLPVLEAMQSGLPVVTGNQSSLPEVGGEAAVTVDVTDPNALREGIETLWNHPPMREKARERGLKRAIEFTWERTAKCVADAMQIAVNKRTTDV